MELDWGNVPAWIGSILTGSSILIAALTYRRSVEDRERAQAAKVTAWVDIGAEKIFLRNSSDSAVRARVFFEDLPNGQSEVATTELQLGPRMRASNSMPS